MSKARLDKIRGVERHDRLDAELFNDFESEDQRKVMDLFSIHIPCLHTVPLTLK